MVNTLHMDYRYFTASEGDLDKLLRGENVAGISDGDFLASVPLHMGETGVLVTLGRTSDEPLRPLAVVCHDEDVRRLCGRYAQLRTELSPLTAWCHLLTPTFHRSLDGVEHQPKFGCTEAAWSGLVVAETLLLTGKALANIRISACLASATYAIGRTKALWGDLAFDAIFERFELANKLCRGKGAAPRNQARMSQVQSSFLPMWSCLSALSDDSKESGDSDIFPLVMALRALQQARACSDPGEAGQLVRPLLKIVPEARSFERLTEMAPEARLKLFDELVATFRETDAEARVRRNALALTTGYLATVAAGGSASLALVEDCADRWPELTGWAYLIGGIGERITWSSGFDGLGRLIARELQRPLRLDEPPTCDFAFDEAIVLLDTELKEPLVHLRIKQAKVLSVALFPGVNIAIPIVDTAAVESGPRWGWGPKQAVPQEGPTGANENVLRLLAEALWPDLRPLVIAEMTKASKSKSRGGAGSQRIRGKGKSDALSQLALRDSRK